MAETHTHLITAEGRVRGRIRGRDKDREVMQSKKACQTVTTYTVCYNTAKLVHYNMKLVRVL